MAPEFIHSYSLIFHYPVLYLLAWCPESDRVLRKVCSGLSVMFGSAFLQVVKMVKNSIIYMILCPTTPKSLWVVWFSFSRAACLLTEWSVAEPFKPADRLLKFFKNVNLGSKVSWCKVSNHVSCVHVLFFNHLFNLSASTLMGQWQWTGMSGEITSYLTLSQTLKKLSASGNTPP